MVSFSIQMCIPSFAKSNAVNSIISSSRFFVFFSLSSSFLVLSILLQLIVRSFDNINFNSLPLLLKALQADKKVKHIQND